jgi:16S rRNA processing protein RimM
MVHTVDGDEDRPAVAPSNTRPVAIGRVVSPFGNKGELKVMPLTDFPERLLCLKQACFLFPDGSERRESVDRVREHKGFFLVKLNGCDTISDAERFRDAHLVIPREDRTPLPEDTYYVDDIIGLRVVTEDGRDLGRIRQVYTGPANDVYDTGRVLIPALKSVVVKVDLAQKVMVIRPLPGMLDTEDAG